MPTWSRARDFGLFFAGAAFGTGLASLALLSLRRSRSRRDCERQPRAVSDDADTPSPLLPSSSCSTVPPRTAPSDDLPSFASALHDACACTDPNYDPSRFLSPPSCRWHLVRLREWEDESWRRRNGWVGRDLCHNSSGTAVRVLSYHYHDATRELVGVVWFGPDAEGHRGLCHGGAMSSLMDDFCGHAAFVSSDGPWSGATVQVNITLKRPVPVGSVLRIRGGVKRREGRKVHVEAVLDDGGDGGGRGLGDENKSGEGRGEASGAAAMVYATLEGLSIVGVKISDQNDEVSTRTWEVGVCEKGRFQRQDSGWKIQ